MKTGKLLLAPPIPTLTRMKQCLREVLLRALLPHDSELRMGSAEASREPRRATERCCAPSTASSCLPGNLPPPGRASYTCPSMSTANSQQWQAAIAAGNMMATRPSVFSGTKELHPLSTFHWSTLHVCTRSSAKDASQVGFSLSRLPLTSNTPATLGSPPGPHLT